MTCYAGIYIIEGSVRRITFEAANDEQAHNIALKWGVGVEGVSTSSVAPAPLPEVYDAKTACKLLGGISRTTLYKELLAGTLERMPETRRVLVTRKSIERRCGGA
jgi:hypothetical protein